MDVFREYELWLEKLKDDDPMREELLAIKGDEKEITDRFYQNIVFGTAGLRGICGAGSNRMNRLTVSRATRGIGDYILKTKDGKDKGVAFAYDCRYHSEEFSFLAASILNATLTLPLTIVQSAFRNITVTYQITHLLISYTRFLTIIKI